MSNADFQTFLVGGMLVLIGAIIFMAWSSWRYVDRQRDMDGQALIGVGHELRVNLQRFLTELSGVTRGEATSPADLLAIRHPQLDALLSRPTEMDRLALTVVQASYEDLAALKEAIRSNLAHGTDAAEPAMRASRVVIEAISTLYLWEEHQGRSPTAAHSTRSWHVRDWMKAHHFDARAIPGLHLRDEVVDCLRTYGMKLTPKPLTRTASEYYAMTYDRKADANAPMWKRRPARSAPTDAEVEAPQTPVQPAQPPQAVLTDAAPAPFEPAQSELEKA